MVDGVQGESIIDRLRNGEKVQCLECSKGYYTTSASDISVSHGFSCNICGSMINVDPIIDIE